MADIAELGFKLDTRDLERGQQALKNTAEAAKKAEEAADNFGSQQKKLGNQTSETTGALAQATNALKGFAVVAAGLTALKMSSDVLREFSREVAALGAISEATGQQMEQLRQQAIALGGSTVYSAGEAAKAQKNLAAAGLSVNEVLKTTPIALQLAQAGAIDLAQASDLLANTMAQTGGTIVDMSRYADVFVKTANLATTDVNLLGSSMKYAAPIATALGISIEQTSAALGVMAQNGLKGEQGGTSLRSALMKMTDITKESEKVLASYNVKVSDLDIQSRGLVPVLETLQKAHFNAADAAKVFGTEAFAGARALYSNIDTLKSWTGELENANGTAKRVAGTMSDNLDGAFKNVKSAVESLIITLSDSTGFETWAKNALNALAGLGGSFSGVNEELVKSGDMSREAADGFDNMRLAIESVAAAALGIGVGMGLAAIPTAVTGITAALEGATAGAWAFNAALIANPISAVIGALVAAGAALYVFRDKELELGGVTAKVGDWIVGAWETARRIVAASVASMVASVDTLGKAFVGIATGNFNAASAAVSSWATQTKQSFAAVGGVTQNTQRIVSAASQAQNASLMRSAEAAIAAKNAEIKASDEKKNKIKADFDAQMAASKAAGALYDQQNTKRSKTSKTAKSDNDKEAEALERILGINTKYTKDLETLHHAYSAGKISLETYRGAVEKLIYSETEQGKAAKKLAEERQKEIEKISETADRLSEQAEVYGMNESAVASYSLAKAQAALITAKETGAIDTVIESLQKEVEARQRVLDETQKLEQRKTVVDSAKAAANAWENTSKDIERALTDSLMRSFDSGKSFGDSLVDYVKNAFKTAAIKVILSPVMGAINAIGAPLYGAVSGAFGGQPSTGGASDISMLSSLSNAFSSTSMGQGIGNLAASGLNYLGGGTSGIVNSTLADIATNAPLTSNLALSGVGLAGSLGGGMLAGSLFGNKGYASTGGSIGGGLASTLALSAGLGPMGVIGAGLAGSLVGGGLGSLFGDSGPDMRTSTFAKQFGEKLNADLSEVFKNNKWFSGSEMNTTLSAFNKQIEAMDSTLQSTLHLTTAQQTAADEALKAVSAKVYQFGEQWTDWTQSGAQLAILKDRYAAVLDATESGWGDFVSSFSGDATGFATYLDAVVSALQMFKDDSAGLQEVFGQQIASIKEFESVAKAGETSAQAFSRLYSVFQLTNEVLKSLGHATDGVNLSTTALREQFIALAGGTDQLSGYVSAYYDGFYTQNERNARVMQDLQAEFAKYGATVPATRDEWRKLMESLDLSTDIGQKAAVKLYQLQGAFLSVTQSIEDVQAAQQQAVTDAKSAVADAYTRESDAIRQTIDRLTSFIAQIRTFKESLYLGDLSPLSKLEQYNFAKTQFEQVQALAIAGNEDAQAQLEQSAKDFLTYSKAYNANSVQYQTDFDRVQAILGQVQSSASSQLSAAQAQLSRLDAMVTGIVDVKGAVQSLTDAINAWATANAVIKKAQTGVTIANGVATSNVTGQSATVGAIQDYITQQVNAGDLQSIYSAATSQGFTSSQLATIAQGAGYNVSSSDINAWASANNLPTFATGGDFTGGLRVVGENGPELEATGASRIFNASQTRSILSGANYGGSSVQPLLEEIRALREEVTMLRNQQAQEHSNDLQQREAIAVQSAQLAQQQTRSIERAALLNS